MRRGRMGNLKCLSPCLLVFACSLILCHFVQTTAEFFFCSIKTFIVSISHCQTNRKSWITAQALVRHKATKGTSKSGGDIGVHMDRTGGKGFLPAFPRFPPFYPFALVRPHLPLFAPIPPDSSDLAGQIFLAWEPSTPVVRGGTAATQSRDIISACVGRWRVHLILRPLLSGKKPHLCRCRGLQAKKRFVFQCSLHGWAVSSVWVRDSPPPPPPAPLPALRAHLVTKGQ